MKGLSEGTILGVTTALVVFVYIGIIRDVVNGRPISAVPYEDEEED